jgi:hypothetical protein
MRHNNTKKITKNHFNQPFFHTYETKVKQRKQDIRTMRLPLAERWWDKPNRGGKWVTLTQVRENWIERWNCRSEDVWIDEHDAIGGRRWCWQGITCGGWRRQWRRNANSNRRVNEYWNCDEISLFLFFSGLILIRARWSFEAWWNQEHRLLRFVRGREEEEVKSWKVKFILKQ